MNLTQQYRALHERGHFQGLSVLKFKDQIKDLIDEFDATSLLDYGSGQGRQYYDHSLDEYWGLTPTLYDPAVPGIDVLPNGTFDGVVCSDVLEHLEETWVPQVLERLFSYANKFVFMSVCPRPAKKLLPDGRNVHLTVRPEEWWREQIERVADKHFQLEITE